jgi:hypothetical protein
MIDFIFNVIIFAICDKGNSLCEVDPVADNTDGVIQQI